MNYLEKFIIEQNKKSEDIIRKAFPMPFGEVKDEIIKAKRAQIGEVREWGGVKMRKEANGWVPVRDGSGKPKGEEPTGKEGGETPSIEEHAKKASEAALQNAIKNSPDPEVRAAAHKELQRRTTEEKSEMFSKPEGEGGEPAAPKTESKPEPKAEEPAKQKVEPKPEPKKEEPAKEEKQPDKKIEPKEVDEMMAKYSEGKATVDEVTEFIKKYDAQKKGVKGVDDNIKKSLSEDIVERRTAYKFLEGQSNLLHKSHINEFVFNDNFSVSKTGLELKKKFEEQLKMEVEEIRENSRKASECLKEIGEQPTESFEDEYYLAIDGYEDKIKQLPMIFRSGGETIDTKYSNQERTIQDKKYDYNGLARKIVDGMIEIIHLNTLINSMIDGKTYKLNIRQAAILGF